MVVPADAGPVEVRPDEHVGVDYLGWAHRSLRLKAGGRVGKQVGLAVQAIPIEGTGAGRFDGRGEVAGRLRFERDGGQPLEAIGEHDLHLASLRSPDTETDTARSDFGAAGKSARARRPARRARADGGG